MITLLARFMYNKAKDNAAFAESLRLKYEETLLKVMENQGREIASGNMGDASISYMTNGMTLLDYLAALELAIKSLDAGQFINCKKIRVTCR